MIQRLRGWVLDPDVAVDEVDSLDHAVANRSVPNPVGKPFHRFNRLCRDFDRRSFSPARGPQLEIVKTWERTPSPYRVRTEHSPR